MYLLASSNGLIQSHHFEQSEESTSKEISHFVQNDDLIKVRLYSYLNFVAGFAFVTLEVCQ